MAYTWNDLSAGNPLAAAALNGLGNEVEALSSLVKDPIMASMSRATQFTTGVSWSQVMFTAVDYESIPGMAVDADSSPADSRFVIPQTGLWSVNLNYSHGTLGSGARGSLVIKNSTTISSNGPYEIYSLTAAQSTGAHGANLSATIPLTQGDVIRFYVFAGSALASYVGVQPRASILLTVPMS